MELGRFVVPGWRFCLCVLTGRVGLAGCVGGGGAVRLSSLTLLAVSAGRHEAEAGGADDHAARFHRAVGRRIGEDDRTCRWM